MGDSSENDEAKERKKMKIVKLCFVTLGLMMLVFSGSITISAETRADVTLVDVPGPGKPDPEKPGPGKTPPPSEKPAPPGEKPKPNIPKTGDTSAAGMNWAMVILMASTVLLLTTRERGNETCDKIKSVSG